jgi:hypothetical protein
MGSSWVRAGGIQGASTVQQIRPKIFTEICPGTRTGASALRQALSGWRGQTLAWENRPTPPHWLIITMRLRSVLRTRRYQSVVVRYGGVRTRRLRNKTLGGYRAGLLGCRWVYGGFKDGWHVKSMSLLLSLHSHVSEEFWQYTKKWGMPNV